MGTKLKFSVIFNRFWKLGWNWLDHKVSTLLLTLFSRFCYCWLLISLIAILLLYNSVVLLIAIGLLLNLIFLLLLVCSHTWTNLLCFLLCCDCYFAISLLINLIFLLLYLLLLLAQYLVMLLLIVYCNTIAGTAITWLGPALPYYPTINMLLLIATFTAVLLLLLVFPPCHTASCLSVRIHKQWENSRDNQRNTRLVITNNEMSFWGRPVTSFPSLRLPGLYAL